MPDLYDVVGGNLYVVSVDCEDELMIEFELALQVCAD